VSKTPSNIKVITTNRKASFNYVLEDKLEAGMVLTGTEIKSIRDNQININDAYVMIRNEEAFLINSHISAYKHGNVYNHEPGRTRKLLLHKSQIQRLMGKVEAKGYTLIPTQVYFKKGMCKLELALGKSKKTLDKRDKIKKRELDREAERAMKYKK